MKGIFFLTILFISFLWPLFLMADEKEDPCHKTTEGKDFWFAFMESRNYRSAHYVEVTLTSPNTCNYEIRIGKSNAVYSSGTVLPGVPSRFKIPWNLVEATGSEQIQEKAIHLTSDNPMNVYALNYDANSADVALIFPTSALGSEYYAICYEPHVKKTATGAPSDGQNSEFLIVAAEDNTTVTIIPSKVTDKKNPANVPIIKTLNKGEVYQVQSMNDDNMVGQGDLTGSYVTSDKPVAFFSGSLSTTVPYGVSVCCWDHLFEQIPPVQAWGKLFMAVPLKSRQKDTYRVMAAYDNTIVKVGSTQQVLQKGKYYEFMLDYTDPRIIESTKPILLVQYSNSQSVDAAFTGNNGDPFMIVVSPLIQTKQNVTFVAYNSANITNRYFVNVIAKDDATSFISLDQYPVLFTSLPNSGYSYAQVSITQGTHKLITSQADKGFIAYVYGFGGVESYGYGVGFNLDIQLDLGGNVNKDTLLICQGIETKLEVGAYFDIYQWRSGETAPFIMVSKEGMYKITATTLGGCKLSDSLYVKVNDPKIDLGPNSNSCGPGIIILDAGKKFKSYQWQDGSTNQTYKVLTTGDYSVTGTNEFGCQASDTVHVDVFQVPEITILGETLHCGFTAELKVNITNADSALWNYSGAAKWTCNSTDLNFQNIKPNGVTLKANKPGLYTVNYVLTTKDGCQVTDSFIIGFYDIPESTFAEVTQGPADKCSTYTRIFEYTGKSGPTAKFYWDFGGLIVIDTIAPNHFKVSIGANKTNRTITLFVEEHGCTSPVTSISIGVKPNFEFWADKVHGCDSLCVRFNSKLDVAIKDSMAYHWTFGDGAVSKLQNPTHCYLDTGKYDVSLMVTNVIDGCRNGSVEPEMIKIYKTPVAKLSADPEFCYDYTVSFEYLNKKDYSHCEWFTKGNELISSQNTSATYLLKNEISEVGFIVEENGCKCDTFKVEVKRKPNFDFEAVEPEICLPIPATLKAIPNDPNLQFSWSVDSLFQVNGDSLVHLFSKPGLYSVTLQVFSELTGCSDQLTKLNYIQIYPLPFPAFSQNYPVATLEHPDISFSNQTEGAASYLWTFGDGGTSIEKDPLHHYSEIGEYEVILYATTDFGCVDTTSSSVKIIPFSFFTPNAFRPDSEIPENRIFLPIQEGIDPGKYQFQVFSRVGSTVFETKNPETGWDGKMPNGTSAGPGVFVWVVKYSDIQGYEHLQKGTVMLVR